MANKREQQRQRELDMGLTPSWPTTMKTFYPNGMCVGTDNSVWLYMQVGMGSVADAKNKMEAVEVGQSLMHAYDELALMATPVRDQRNMSRASYRTTKLMFVNIPQAFLPPKGHPNAEWLYRKQRSTVVHKRALVLGIKLRDSLTTEGIGVKAATRAFVSSIASGSVPIEFYSKDYKRVRQAMERAGLQVPAPEIIRLVNSYFNQGDFPDIPIVPHAKHIHFLRTDGALRDFETQKEAGRAKDCEDWPTIPGSHIISFASVTRTNLLFDNIEDPSSHWLVDIVDDNAVCVSITAKIEPAKVTRKELTSSRKKIVADVMEKAKNNKDARSEEEEALKIIGYLIDGYGRKPTGASASPTLYETSIIVGFAGRVDDIQTVATNSKAEMALMDHRQQAAMTETMLCSGVTANPNLHELPTQAIAHSGIQSLSEVGDSTGGLLGFTERDRQPAWISPTAASSGDDPPIMIVAGQSGSGKALPLSCRLPTPTGWTTMGEVAVGDQLLGRDGKAVTVTSLSPIEQNPEMFELILDHGESVRATRDHLWTITADWVELGFDAIGFRLTAKHLHTLSTSVNRENTQLPRVLDPASALTWLSSHKIQHPYITSELLIAALDATDTPYTSTAGHRLYGVGDLLRGLGMRLTQLVNDSSMVDDNEAVVTTAELRGFSNANPRRAQFSIRTAAPLEGVQQDHRTDFRSVGRNAGAEVVPLSQELLRMSTPQRWDLLGGLMDLLGDIAGSGDEARYVLRSTDADCADSYAELIGSLGITLDVISPKENIFEISFRTSHTLFDSGLNIDVPAAATTDVTHRLVLGVVPCVSEPARCLSVGSADASYLCGRFLPTHNTMVLLLLAIQFAMMGSPVVIADPKTNSNHDDTVLAYGGQVMSLDSIVNSDSVFDPIYFMGQSERTGGIEEAISLASSLIMSLDLWGAYERGLYEAAIPMALNYGVAKGADCTGRALELADEARKNGELVGVPEDLWGRIKMVITPESASMARAIIGMNPVGKALSFSEGLSLIKVGRSHLDLPAVGMPPQGLSQKISMALVRMMVYGSVVSVSHRSGVVLLDEGWIFLSFGQGEVMSLGRLARHLQVLPVIFTQKITDALDADLEDFVSRGLILPIKNPAEAKLALKAFEVEETPELVARLTASAITGGQSAGQGGEPNWNSMRALFDKEPDPVTGVKKVLRGTIGIYIDRARRAVPVEIRLPDGFLDIASTRPEDVKAREKVREKIAKNAAERMAREAEEAGAHQPSSPRIGGDFVADGPNLMAAYD